MTVRAKTWAIAALHGGGRMPGEKGACGRKYERFEQLPVWRAAVDLAEQSRRAYGRDRRIDAFWDELQAVRDAAARSSQADLAADL